MAAHTPTTTTEQTIVVLRGVTGYELAHATIESDTDGDYNQAVMQWLRRLPLRAGDTITLGDER